MKAGHSVVPWLAWLCSFAALIACAACGGSSTGAANAAPPRLAQVAGLQPSASARMVCSAEGQHEIAASIGVEPTRPVAGRWNDQVYACSYVYADGHEMVLSVKELRSTRQTGTYFDALGSRLGRGHALQGLGQGAYQTASGSTVVRKDNLVLLVDVTRLPAHFGVPSTPKADVSLSIAATIMGCWTGA